MDAKTGIMTFINIDDISNALEIPNGDTYINLRSYSERRVICVTDSIEDVVMKINAARRARNQK